MRKGPKNKTPEGEGDPRVGIKQGKIKRETPKGGETQGSAKGPSKAERKNPQRRWVTQRSTKNQRKSKKTQPDVRREGEKQGRDVSRGSRRWGARTAVERARERTGALGAMASPETGEASTRVIGEAERVRVLSSDEQGILRVIAVGCPTVDTTQSARRRDTYSTKELEAVVFGKCAVNR